MTDAQYSTVAAAIITLAVVLLVLVTAALSICTV
jgi:hypothetical protein